MRRREATGRVCLADRPLTPRRTWPLDRDVRAALVVLWVAVAVELLASPASAQTNLLAEGQRLFRRGDFEAAAQAYDRALETREGLSRDDVLAIQHDLALVRAALRDDAGAERALTALLSLDAAATLDDRAPPSLGRTLERLRAEVVPLSIADAEAPAGAETVLTIRVVDPASLVREVRVELQDGDAWTPRVGTEHRLPPGTAYVVTAIGPGGAVLLTLGDRDAPRTLATRVVPTREDSLLASDAPTDPTEPRSERRAWPWVVGVGAVVLAGVGVALAIALRPNDVRTQPTGPMPIP